MKSQKPTPIPMTTKYKRIEGYFLKVRIQIWNPTNSSYRISSYSFSGIYSFLNLEIVANSNSCRNISIFYLINWIFAVETIWGNKVSVIRKVEFMYCEKATQNIWILVQPCTFLLTARRFQASTHFFSSLKFLQENF